MVSLRAWGWEAIGALGTPPGQSSAGSWDPGPARRPQAEAGDGVSGGWVAGSRVAAAKSSALWGAVLRSLPRGLWITASSFPVLDPHLAPHQLLCSGPSPVSGVKWGGLEGRTLTLLGPHHSTLGTLAGTQKVRACSRREATPPTPPSRPPEQEQHSDCQPPLPAAP